MLPEPITLALTAHRAGAPAGPMTAELVRGTDVLRRGIAEQRKILPLQ